MSFYPNLQATAVRLLTKYGQAYTFTAYAQGAYNPATGTNSITTSTYSKLGVKDSYSTFEKSNASIQAGDIRMIVEDGPYTIGDTVSIAGVDWRIMAADPVEPASTAVIYTLQLRRG